MNNLATAKCDRCGGSATGSTFDDAKSLIDHAVGLSRGIPCGDNYNAVIEIKDTSSPPPAKPKTAKAASDTTTPKNKPTEKKYSKEKYL